MLTAAIIALVCSFVYRRSRRKDDSTRFYLTETRKQSGSSETAAKAGRNTKEVADKRYIKPTEVLPDVRRAVDDWQHGLVELAG
jgi:hypothetical protein